MPQAVMSQVAQLSMWGRKRSRASSASPVGRMCESAQLRNAAAQHPVGVDARREAGRKGCVAGVGQCEKVFGDGFH